MDRFIVTSPEESRWLLVCVLIFSGIKIYQFVIERFFSGLKK